MTQARTDDSTESRVTDLERAKQYIDVYKHHWDMYVKGNVFLYAIIGALTGYTFRDGASTVERMALSVLVAFAAAIGIFASRRGRAWLRDFKHQIHAIEARLGEERFPLAGVDQTLALFGWGSLVLLAGAVLLAWYVSTRPSDIAEAAQALKPIEQRLATAWKEGDCEAWGAMVAPEWSVIHVTGVLMTKPQAMQLCRTPHAPINTFTIDDLSVRPFGHAAVVTGRTTVTIGGPKPETMTLRFTDVFIRQEGRWRVVASHATRLAG